MDDAQRGCGSAVGSQVVLDTDDSLGGQAITDILFGAQAHDGGEIALWVQLADGADAIDVARPAD